MSMPGFTADISLYCSRKRYTTAVGRSPLAGGEMVIPAAHFDEGFWELWGSDITTCPPPFCHLNEHGQCRCLVVKI
jgi:hypothetical protein